MRAVHADVFGLVLQPRPARPLQFPSEAACYALSLVRRDYQETFNEMSGMRRFPKQELG
jgi:hypothetical protein